MSSSQPTTLTSVREVEGCENWVVMFGSDLGMRGVQQHSVCAQHLLQLLLQTLLLL